MKKNIMLGVWAVILLSLVFGCKEKTKEQEATDLAPIPAKEEAVSAINAHVVPPASNAQASAVQASASEGAAEPIAVAEKAGASKPSEKEIQQALKNAGFYDGEVDGKIGPKTKKAIEEFQAKNNLKVDAKVGPMTWEKLKGYLTANPEPAVSQAKN